MKVLQRLVLNGHIIYYPGADQQEAYFNLFTQVAADFGISVEQVEPVLYLSDQIDDLTDFREILGLSGVKDLRGRIYRAWYDVQMWMTQLRSHELNTFAQMATHSHCTVIVCSDRGAVVERSWL